MSKDKGSVHPVLPLTGGYLVLYTFARISMETRDCEVMVLGIVAAAMTILILQLVIRLDEALG